MSVVTKARLLSLVGALLVRAVIATLRFRVTDHAGVLAAPTQPPVIWVFWHNRLFVMAHFFNRYLPGRPGAALTSASKDGEILAAFLKRFGIRPIRGSSSRRGAAALLEMKRTLAEGRDIGITPDGPRGPRYRFSPGAVALAQQTGAALVPAHVAYSSCWQLASWDGFMIPKPFSRVHIIVDPMRRLVPDCDDAGFEAERQRLEEVLRSGISDEPNA